MKTDFLIVGAGLTGLHLANKLKNKKVLILEKSRGLGGRIATRRIENLGFDHGSPILPNSPQTWHLLEFYGLEKNVLSNDEGVFFSQGMTQLPKKMGNDLEIKLNERALRIKNLDSGWLVETDQNQIYETKNLILTCPLPQSLELLNDNFISYPQKLNDVKYDMALIGLFILDDAPVATSPKFHLGHNLHFTGPRGLHPKGLVLRASPEFSLIHFDQDQELNIKRLEGLAELMLEKKLNFVNCELKKWKFVQPTIALPTSFETIAPGLFLAGDSFLSRGIKGSILSSEALARQLI